MRISRVKTHLIGLVIDMLPMSSYKSKLFFTLSILIEYKFVLTVFLLPLSNLFKTIGDSFNCMFSFVDNLIDF